MEKEIREVMENKSFQSFQTEEPTYEESLHIARDMCGFPGGNIEGEDVLKLISLVCQLTVLYRSKTPQAQPVHIISKAYGKATTKGAIKQYRQLSLLCELFITDDAKFSMHGYKSVTEMLEEIRRIMDLWLPF